MKYISNKTQELYESIVSNKEKFFLYYKYVKQFNYNIEQLTNAIEMLDFRGADTKQVANRLMSDFVTIK